MAREKQETIWTERLFLRRPVASDAQAIFDRYASDPEVTRYLSWPTHRRIEATQAFLAWSDADWARWPASSYLVFGRENSERLLGGTGIAFQNPALAVTGYVFARDAWGQGYATEALEAMVGLARRTGVRYLVAVCHPSHRPSAHVLEKCGFLLDEERRDAFEFPNLRPKKKWKALTYMLNL
jgi:[ribosomal protein S5]-alanine N-acetyltransferase